MKLMLLNTPQGLKPCYDDDYEAKKRLKLGEVYSADIYLARNWEFHKRFFALIKAAFAILPEKTQNGFRSEDGFRAYLTVAAGYYDVFYNPRLREFTEIPKSIRFSSMDEAEFEQLYQGVKDVILGLIKSHTSEEQFDHFLMDF